MSKSLRQAVVLWGIAALPFMLHAQQRIRSAITDSPTFILKNHTRPVIAHGALQDIGNLAGSYSLPHLSLHFTMTPAQQADLTQLLEAQQNRRSPNYHRFLTPEEYAARFGLSETDLAKVTRWLENSGFHNLQTARSRTWISFSGTASQAESAFHTSLRQYTLNGESHFANAADPKLPKALSGIVQRIGGLHNFSMKPHLARPHPDFTFGSTGLHFLAPDDWATIYNVQPLYGAGLDGSGVTIAVVGQSNIALSDIQAFRAAAGLPFKNPSILIPPGDQDPGIRSSTGEETEADLDIEWAGGIARNANILLVTASATAGNGVEDAITYTIDNNLAPILSTSYGFCEQDGTAADFATLDNLFQQASAQGMTIVAASGDWGATGCDYAAAATVATHGLAVDYPASSQYVTGIGGTEFTEFGSGFWNNINNSYNGSAVSYIPETAWNDGFQSASGGGASILFSKPAWQSGLGVPADNARDVPDLAFTASPDHDGLLICGSGSCANGFVSSSNRLNVMGGTSAGAPAFAGVLALLVQKNGAGNRLGNINANLYSLAQISANTFHDVTSGNNLQLCQVGTTGCSSAYFPTAYLGYSAQTGYDQVTGLGSLDAYNFTEQWNGDIQLAASPSTLTIASGQAGTSTITVTPQNNFTGPVSFTCSVASTLVDVTCSIPGTVNTSGSVTLTITAASTAHTPWWKTFRPAPPPRYLWFLLPLLLALAFFFFVSKAPVFHKPLFCGASSALLLAIAIGVVSCGGTGSPTVTAPQITPLSLSCTLPTNAQAGQQFSGTCTASGGTAPYKFSIASGSLPAGLALNPATGAISGTPASVGTGSFTVQVSDSATAPQLATQAQNVTINPGYLQVTCNLLNAIAGVPYSASCSTVYGTPPYTYSLLMGQPPSGITLNPTTGVFSGVATSAGYGFTVQATDSSSPPRTSQTNGYIGLVTTSANGLVALNCGLFLGGYVGVPVSIQCSALNGQGPFTYSVAAGALPPGLTLNSSTGAISGTPALQGSFNITFKVTDSGTPANFGLLNVFLNVGHRLTESGLVTVTATSGGIVNTTTVSVTVP